LHGVIGLIDRSAEVLVGQRRPHKWDKTEVIEKIFYRFNSNGMPAGLDRGVKAFIGITVSPVGQTGTPVR